MNYKVNTVIIGGGPSGTACGTVLQAKGVSSMIIEKSAYPREKLCAGLVTDKTYRQIQKLWNLRHQGEQLPDDLFCSVTNDVEFSYGNERMIKSRSTKPFHLVQRAHFDQFLAGLYKESGGTLLENSTCTAIDMNQHRLTLKSGDTVSFRHLVAADGAVSRTRTMLGYEKPLLGFCMETRVPMPEGVRTVPVKVIFGTIENGYAWIFPSGDQICAGIISVYDQSVDYCAEFDSFLKAHNINAPKNTWKGAFIPYGNCADQSSNHPDAVMVGDAGGFVDPIYGEGLYFALSTGITAAKAVILSMNNKTEFRTEFIRETAKYAEIIQQGLKLQKLLFSSKLWKCLKNRVRNRNRFAGFYMDHLVSAYHYRYSDIWKMMLYYKLRGEKK